MVAFDTVVRVPLRIVERPRDLLFDHSFQRLGEIGHDLNWCVVGEQCGIEELAAGRNISAL